MKRAAVLLSGLLVAVLVFAACGGGATATPVPKPRATNTPVPTSAAPTAAPTATTAAATAAPTTAEVVRLAISVNGDALEFDKGKLTADAGSQVVLTFSNVSSINQHNWVLVMAGTKDDAATRGSLHATTGWIDPDDPDVIAQTKLLDPGTTGEVSFAAPSPGTYQFVCTFPAHNITMFGDFEVTG